jgi:hypothetical protein
LTSCYSDDAFVRLFQTTFGLESDGSPATTRWRSLAARAGVDVPAVPHADIPDDYWRMRQIESNNQLYVQAPTSSASGHYQFIRATRLVSGRPPLPLLR